MPVFNEEKHLEECVQSIINQDFKDWELIAIDDFSTDQSFQVLGQFGRIDERITVMQNDSKGIIPALKKAFLIAQGNLCTRMDADDIMPSHKLSKMVDRLSLLGKGHVVSGKVKYFSREQLQGGFIKYEGWINQQQYYGDIYRECTLPSACWMAYRSDLLEINAFIDTQYPEDYDLLFKFYKHDFTIHGIDHILHLWRDHPNRASRNDPHYKDQNFFPLKVNYFLELDRINTQPLYLWGAGQKGKSLAKTLLTQDIKFQWVTENHSKIGQNIYGVILQDSLSLRSPIDKQVITAISDKAFQKNRDDIVQAIHYSGNRYFHFC